MVSVRLSPLRGGVTDHGALAGLLDDDHPQYLRVDGTRAMGATLDMGGFNVANVGLVDGVDVGAHVADASIHFTQASIDHGGIAGLTDDDHPQYLLVDGTRAMGAALDMGTFAITNVGTVDGVDVSAHAADATIHYTVASIDHGSVAGLADDDHPQYLLADGTRAMTGALDMGTNAVTNVGLVDGVDVSAHAARHERGGADALDGDHLGIDFTPASYTPDITPPEAANVDDLAAHLAGIDNALGAAITDHGALAGLGDDDHTQYLLVNGSRPMAAALDMGTFAITNVGLVDGVDVSTHAARHERGAADELDGDHLDIDYTPAYYAPDATPAEANTVDDLAAHLAGISNKFGTLPSSYLLIDGSNAMAGDLDLGGYSFTNVGSGTDAAPAYNFQAAATTGMFYNAVSGYLGFSVGATQEMRIDANGVTIPASYLNIQGQQQIRFGGAESIVRSANELRVGGVHSSITTLALYAAGAAIATVSATGLGIGTSSPAELLHAYDATGTAIVQAESGSSSALLKAIGGGGSASLWLQSSTRTWRLQADGDLTLRDVSGGNVAVVTVETACPADLLYLDRAGNVGVGTSSPGSPLSVLAASPLTGSSIVSVTATTPGASIDAIHTAIDCTGRLSFVCQQNNAATGSAEMVTRVLGTGDAKFKAEINGGQAWSWGLDNSDGDKFKIADGSTLGTNDRLVIDTAGNVGIGTSSPSTLLHLYEATGDLVPRLQTAKLNGTVGWWFQNDAITWVAKVNGSDNFVIRDETNTRDLFTIHDGAGTVQTYQTASGFGIAAAPSYLLHVTATGNSYALLVNDSNGRVFVGTNASSGGQLNIGGGRSIEFEGTGGAFVDSGSAQDLHLRGGGSAVNGKLIGRSSEVRFERSGAATLGGIIINGAGTTGQAPAYLLDIIGTGGSRVFGTDGSNLSVGINTAPTGSTKLTVDAGSVDGVVVSGLGAGKWAYKMVNGTQVNGAGLITLGANGSQLLLRDGTSTTLRLYSDSTASYINTGGGLVVGSTGHHASSRVSVYGRLGYNADGTNGQGVALASLTELTTIAASAFTDTTIQIPQYAIVYAVSVRVTTAIPTATTFSVGVSGATSRYGSGLSTAANTTHPGTNAGAGYYGSATAIRITPNATPASSAGRVRVTIHYFLVTPPTS